MAADTRSGKKPPAAASAAPVPAAPRPAAAEDALVAVRAATLAIHGMGGCSHPLFDALTGAGRELVLGLLFHAIDDTERVELASLGERVDEAQADRERVGARVKELRRQLGIANEDTESLRRMVEVLEAIERHSALLERIRASIEDESEYRAFLESFGGRVVAVQAEWRRRLNEIDAAIVAARDVLKREYDQALGQWTAVEKEVLRS